MEDKGVLIQVIDVKNDCPIRTEWTTIPSEVLKMYHYMKQKDDLFIYFQESETQKDPRYNDVEAEVEDISVCPGGDGYLLCIKVYVKILGE